MDYRHSLRAISARDVSAFVAIGLLHAMAIYFFASQAVTDRGALWTRLEVTFIPREKPKEPPPPPPLPVLLTDAFNEISLPDVPAPTVQIATPEEEGRAIHVVPPEPPPSPAQDAAPQGDQGFGPISKPRVLSGPHTQDRYPRASIYNHESGRPVIKVCISEQGTVTDVQLAETSGFQRLDRAAVDLGWEYVFAPAMREGKPIAVCLPYGITFRINIGGIRRRR
jgi:protein TonB